MTNFRQTMAGTSVLLLLSACGGGDTSNNTESSQAADATDHAKILAASTATPTAVIAPSITKQPQSTSIFSGNTASFSISLSSASGVTYQWLKNGVAITGARTATYTTPASSYADNLAKYSVTVSGSGWKLTSSSATLTVNPRVIQISTGGYTSSALKDDGSIWSWGYHYYLGAGGYDVPVGTMVRTKLQDGTWFGPSTQLAAGYAHTIAIKNDGTVWGWGDNSEGEIGIGTTTPFTTYYPVKSAYGASNYLQGFKSISGGWRYSLGLKNDGTVWGWGYALEGRLGNNNSSGKRQFPNATAVLDTTGKPISGITQISAGDDHAAALKSDGTVLIWGNGQAGRLGDGQRNSMAYVAKRLNSYTGLAISGVKQVSAGQNHSVALLTDGSVLAWGGNGYGQLSDGTSTERDWPTRVMQSSAQYMSSVKSAFAGGSNTVFLKNDGTVWVSGSNLHGALGNGANINYSLIPVQVKLPSGQPLTGIEKIAISYSSYSTVLALAADGTVWAWGDNTSGQAGVSGAVYYKNPVKVSVSGN